MSLVTCKDLSKTYGSTTALSHINLDIEEGHIIGLLGPNGSGKTTLIKILNGLLTPSARRSLYQGGSGGYGIEKSDLLSA